MTHHTGLGHAVRRITTFAAVVALAVTGLSITADQAAADPIPGVPPIEQRTNAAVTADPLPTVQIDSGVVWAQTVIGNTVYAGGSFSNARAAGAAPGTSLTPRANLLAYDIRTGALLPNFAPQLNGQVKAVAASPDGSRLYVGGTFTTANGESRFNLAAFNAVTGALISTFKASAGGSYVNAIAVTNSTVYVGGLIGAGNGVTRKNFAAFDTAGKLLAWAPVTDLQVDAMVLTPKKDKLIVGGRFSTVNNVSQRGLAALDLTNGALLPWAAPQTVINGWNQSPYAGKAGIFSLSADANNIYGTGWVYATAAVGNLEGTFSAEPDSGAIRWVADCHGDTYSAFSNGTNVYTTSHNHDCSTLGGMPQASPAPGNARHAVALTTAVRGTLSRSPSTGQTYKDWSGTPAPAVVNWFPDWTTGSFTGQGQAGWTTTGNTDYVAVGGEFPYVNGLRQQGLVRFARPGLTTPDSGPRLSGDRWVPSVVSVRPGAARISVPVNWDRDDLDLTYQLRRNGVATPLETRVVRSTFWDKSILTFNDTGLTPGATYTYRLIATDPDGNSVNSASVDVTIAAGNISDYAEAVLDDGASLFWRMGSPVSSAAQDWATGTDGQVGSGVTSAASGAVIGDSNVAANFSGTSTGRIAGVTTVAASPVFSTEAWIKTTTVRGGKIVGYGDALSGNSSSYDRHVYMQNNGRITFGVYPGGVRTISSATSYNDGAWHHIVASQGPGGISLTIDGAQVASDASVTTAQDYNGRWRVGGDNLNGWPNPPTSVDFAGTIDEVAIYPSVLSLAQIRNHYVEAGYNLALPTPTATFDAEATGLDVSFDASGSTPSSGRTITSYAWNFGDSTTGTGVSPDHTYTTAGTRTVTLTVTDSAGLTDTFSKTVVTTAHSAPTAAFDVDTSGLTATFDSSGSVAHDGATITSYAWNFGDSKTATTANPVHAYAAAGEYEVTLKVTDSQGAPSTVVTKTVTVTHAAPKAVSAVTVVDDLAISADAEGSTASDGATLTYDWNWGDQTAHATTKAATHTYANAGTFAVVLTVTDSLGSTNSVSKSVTVSTQPVETDLARDGFGRTSGTSWGTADVGGAWTASAGLDVADGKGRILLSAAKVTRKTYLADLAVKDVDATVSVALDKVADGGGTHVDYLVRRTASGFYHLKVRTSSTGVVTVSLARTVGTTETIITTKTLTGAYTPNTVLNLRLQAVSAGSSTNLQAKVWRAADAEPAAWLTTAADSTAGLQVAGQVGLGAYLTGTSTSAPVRVSFDNLRVTAP